MGNGYPFSIPAGGSFLHLMQNMIFGLLIKDSSRFTSTAKTSKLMNL